LISNLPGSTITDLALFSADKFPVHAGAEALLKLEPDKISTSRSVSDARLFRQVSPSVVLVATDTGLGSGALLSREGLVITNWHVISGAQEVGVIFKPEREGAQPSKGDIRRATVIKFDEIADLALLKVSVVPSKVTPIRLGDISDIGVGIDVHAIGHPTGEAWTYTKGVISQYREAYEWGTDAKMHKANVIQTQTPINPGNSGGPLIVNSGVMIGINSFKATGTEGLNFAVSIDDVKNFLSRPGNRFATEMPAKQQKEEASACEAKELYRGANNENTGDIIGFDLNCDGVADSELRIPYDKTQPIVYAIDTNGDRRPDVVIFDTDRKGKWAFSFWDTDFDGKWDLVGFHEDGTLKASRYESYDKLNSALARKR
jgi:hypothetical protein